jgi:hypothetical protein
VLQPLVMNTCDTCCIRLMPRSPRHCLLMLACDMYIDY